MVLEKTFESPLVSTEIKPVNCKLNQPWIFIRRTDAEALILWPPDVKSQFIGKDPTAGKDWRQKEKGVTEDEMVRYHHWLNGHESEQTPGDSGGQRSWLASVREVVKSQTWLSNQITATYTATTVLCTRLEKLRSCSPCLYVTHSWILFQKQ